MLSGISRFLKIKKGNYKINFSRNVLALNCFVDPNSRNEEELIIKSLLKSGDTYVDVGANIGTLCLASFKNINNLSVYAFEANPNTFKTLERNFKLNQLYDAHTYQVALGEKDQEITFSNIGTDDQNGVVKEGISYKRTLRVQMKKLDQVVILPKISLLKIDVEGYELFVLQGALQNLKNCAAIYFEYSPINTSKYNYHPLEIIKLLESLNFSIHIPIFKNEEIVLTQFLPSNHESDLNLLAINNNSQQSFNKMDYQSIN
ncbi:FkbM family methyltransferase [Pedobacter polaris]|uniref:FkbM family methyltransferase n=1 Tax=Pedobacter polaris TaxID=2571273 RepID=UPI00145CAEC3|nr:FkbM family methyltransferase [Pedobacter polaris]